MCGPSGSCDNDEGTKKRIESRLFKGIDYAKGVVKELIDKKIYFRVEPLSDDRYIITVKAKDAEHLNTLGK